MADEQDAAGWPPQQLTFATVAAFKGLENRYIAFIDLDAISEQAKDLSLLYVGMSRARAGLWLAVRKELEGALKDLSRRNLPLVVKDGAREG